MPAKRIILMYISQVSGHRSAAMAIEKAVRVFSPDAEILSINAFNYTNPISEKVINRLYMSILDKAPQVWDYLYDNPGVVRGLEHIKKAVHWFNSPKLRRLFNDFRPDVIVCTQAFPCGMVADFKKFYHYDVPLVAVLTDYVPHSFWVYDTVDFYITPSEEVSARLSAKGTPAKRIKTFGIPFDFKFNAPVDKKSVLEKLGLDENIPTLLIMGGGHGLGPMNTIVRSLEKVREPIQEIVIAGINKKLFNSLNKQIKKCQKKVKVLGFVDNIHQLMSACEIILTKPGGITVAEALSKKIPMIIIKPLPGQEANNTAYLTQKGAAVEADYLDEINLLVEDLLAHPEKLESLRQAASRISKPNASMDIARLLLE